jgi:ferredoxin-NADP reductase/ferredoxin
MPELDSGSQRWTVAAGSNLLDALNEAGLQVPFSCRAGSCHACLVRCLAGEPQDRKPDALSVDKRERGWRLACQCQVVDDLRVAVFDPQGDGTATRVSGCDWLSANVLRLRLLAERPLRYQAGQHLVLWTCTPDGVRIARPYSIASLAQADDFLEFHLDCRRDGAFIDQARQFKVGDTLQVGEVRGGALHYDPEWQARPLWLFAAGTGLAPLWGVLHEALRQGHHGPIRLLHMANEHYLDEPLRALAQVHPNLTVEQFPAGEPPPLRLSSRQTIALVCGSPISVEEFSRRLFLAGLPRNQLYSDVFIGRG